MIILSGQKGGGAIVFAALSAIDQALWDIKARALGVPVYELFGAKFESTIEVYANGWSTNHDDVINWANAAERPIKDGYRILKCYPLATKQEGGTLRHVQRRQLDTDLLPTCDRSGENATQGRSAPISA